MPDGWRARSAAGGVTTPVFSRPQRKNPTFAGWGFCVAAGEPDDYLLSHGQSALSSAWSRFTVLFGMGRGGTDSLWSSGMTCCRAALMGGTTNLEEVVSGDAHQRSFWGCAVSGTTLISTNGCKTHLL